MTNKCPTCGAAAILITTGNSGGLLEVYCEANCGWQETGVERNARLTTELEQAKAERNAAQKSERHLYRLFLKKATRRCKRCTSPLYQWVYDNYDGLCMDCWSGDMRMKVAALTRQLEQAQAACAAMAERLPRLVQDAWRHGFSSTDSGNMATCDAVAAAHVEADGQELLGRLATAEAEKETTP